MKKILPPILFVIFVILMAFFCILDNKDEYINTGINIFIGLLLISSGLAISYYYSRYFKKNNINIMTFTEPSKIIKTGMYKYSRHPIYLGLVLAIFGMAFIFNASYLSFLLALIFFAITDIYYIRYEEKQLKSKFGKEYEDYCLHVRRWL